MQKRLQTASFALVVLPVLGALLPAPALAQSEISVQPSTGNLEWLTRPYRARSVPEIRLTNSPRMNQLIRAGNLYLTAQDVIALAVENNIDIEVQRYGPLLQQEVLLRARAGGALRSVGSGVAQGPQSVSLQGVSVNSSGGVALSGGNGVSSGGGIVTQLGPGIPSLDPSLFALASFQHATIPLSNTFLTGTDALVQTTRSFQVQYSQNWDFGLSAQLTFASSRYHVNSFLYAVNPYTSGDLDLQVTQNLLQGFGRAVNGRNIRVERNNLKISDLQFQQQVTTTVAAALNLYWDLVSFNEDLRARRQEMTTAQQLLEDNKRQVQIGALAEIEVTRAEAQLYSSQQDLVVAQTNLQQQETILKNVLCRNGIAAAGLESVHIVPLDKIEIPATDNLRPVPELVNEAISKRPEMLQAQLNIQSNEINLVGIKNSLKPTLQAFAELTNNGLTGELNTQGFIFPGSEYLAGGYDNLLAQIFRRNFPNYSAGLSLNIPLRNRAAQSDYATSLLELRQNQLNLRKNTNQVTVDVQNAVIGLQQARVRYDAAAKARQFQQETLSADQRRYSLGASTVFQVIQDQRDLATSQSTEVQAMANYTHARISLDQALGRTLEANNISIDEAMHGRLSRESALPGNLPGGAQ
ncbi:MAG TPA: TolC family protein [Bryobacteraceae bacterium]|nr:TolC family protein [Bryobacteraceae bacterium]